MKLNPLLRLFKKRSILSDGSFKLRIRNIFSHKFYFITSLFILTNMSSIDSLKPSFAQ